ncbi:MAG: hypothetical protein ACREM3_14065 [Candidatus Rokuibacteriota bacterium]
MLDRARLDRARKTPAPPLHFPLRKLALCLDCDACFEFGPRICPACGSETLASLARFLHPVGRLSRDLRGDVEDGAEASRTVPRQLFVVARDREKLYEYVKRAFADNPTVQVILDRRTGERRGAGMPRIPNRRSSDRRGPDASGQLRALGWAIVMLDVADPK